MQRASVLGVAGLTVLLLCGCGSGSKLPEGPTGTVSGKVTYKGQPVPAGSRVVFVYGDKGIPAMGTVGSDGSYSLTMRGGNQLPVGKYTVSVTPPVKATAGMEAKTGDAAYEKQMMQSMKSKGKDKKPAGKTDADSPFPTKYGSDATSGLTFEVKEGENTFDIPLKD